MEDKRLLSKKKGYGLFGFAGFLCAFLWKAEKDLADQTNILWTGRYLLGILAFSLAGVLGGALVCFAVYRLAEGRWKLPDNVWKKKNSAQETPDSIRKRQGAKDRAQKADAGLSIHLSGAKLFWCSLLLILICWLPAYLAYYPAICSYDITIQTGQIVDGSYNDHHPIAHTLLLQGAMKLGELLSGSVNTGIGIYAALQMIFLAGTFAFGIALLRRFGVKRGWLVLLLLYGMFYPFHWYMSISTIKDTVFSAFFVLQMLSLCVLLLRGEQEAFLGRYALLFFVSTIGMILFRNNGKYAMLVLLFFLLLMLWRGKAHRRLWGRILSYAAAGFLVGNLSLTALFSVTNAQQGDKREMLSMPIQQMARCMIYHGGIGMLEEDDNSMRPEDKALINDFLLDESYREYRADISDPVKRHTNTYVPRYRSREFLSTYLHLFVQYPGDYINAMLAVNAGYLSPGDVTHAVINVNGQETGLGYVQTRWLEDELNPRGIFKASKWESLHEKLEKWADDNAYLRLPVLKYLFVPGSFLWLYLLLACCLMVLRKWRMLLPLSLVLGYYGTLFLGPTVQLRYLYPVMVILPFLAFLGLAAKAQSCAGEGKVSEKVN